MAIKLASPKPVLNALAAEAALVLEEIGTDIVVGQHYRGILNVEADALSRLTEGKSIPASLAHLQASKAPARDDRFFRAWPPEWKEAVRLEATATVAFPQMQ